ncbi:hypothetical protein [Picrophilus oshimae]|uniref:Uncharacterized protein n=1 Tax=Picrophilus torridus (strain ATCC 700027 / DSM 9790 / JCM 10055 / NBRC 100828 / KAW 2/3) TaxID=1122961 RepID=A0A8G2FW45_PICTO|nr:hypothetical protein [Picrophilus oshimae]SMD30551.1 hypothetical protein SAMN02745355_0439 [Picrophilus oshimae DSM 9789]
MAREDYIRNNVLLFAGIKGLIEDGNELRKDLLFFRPEIIYITLSKEEIDGLRYFIKNPFEMTLSDYEILYGVNLSRYGEVMTPPPTYIEAVKYADENDIEIEPLDMNEELYEREYSNSIKTFDLIMHSLRKRRIKNKIFRADSAEEFVDLWNSYVDLHGFKRLYMKRLDYIRTGIDNALKNSDKRIMIIIDYDFYKDIKKSYM